ncbi:MAG TPA: hypothetical protein VN108_04905 [Marmoricola sp.]|nr:hypothetical protein [Marmoricola sp.]
MRDLTATEPDDLVNKVVLFEESDAHAVARALTANGFSTRVDQLPFAGEDDDEDHPWAVWTDAPHVMLELAADEFDGWVVYEDPRHEHRSICLRRPSAGRRSSDAEGVVSRPH